MSYMRHTPGGGKLAILTLGVFARLGRLHRFNRSMFLSVGRKRLDHLMNVVDRIWAIVADKKPFQPETLGTDGVNNAFVSRVTGPLESMK